MFHAIIISLHELQNMHVITCTVSCSMHVTWIWDVFHACNWQLWIMLLW